MNVIVSMDISRNGTKAMFLDKDNQVIIHPLTSEIKENNPVINFTVPYYPCSIAKFGFSNDFVLLTASSSCKTYFLIH